MTTKSEQLSLRSRKRLTAMRRVQAEAVARFADRGFDAVTVEEIADAADVSPMSVYRWFGTKEALVIWDEFDPPILAAVDGLVREGRPPLVAVHDALSSLLDEVYDRERDMAVQRAQLIYGEGALLAAADRNMRFLRSALAEVFTGSAGMTAEEAEIAATVAVALLEASVAIWQRESGHRPLATILDETFATHRSLI